MSRRLHLVLLDAKSAADSTGIGIANEADVANESEFGVYATFDHTSSAGVVLIETAPHSSYTGTWAVLATFTWAAIDKVHYFAVTNVVGCIRARISSAVTAGTVTVEIFANVT